MTRNRIALIAGLVVLAVTGIACGGGGGGTPSPSATGTGSPSATAAPTSAAPGGYPNTHRAYAEAILNAWRLGDLGRLGLLTTELVHEQIIEIPGPPNQDWAFVACEEDATVYCAFSNAEGDWISLRIDTDLLGGAHAGSDVEFDATTYPADPVNYVEEFILAWQFANTNRMTRLGNAATTAYFTHYAPPDVYSTCTDAAAGSTYVRVYNADGLNYVIRVTNAALGGPHAIASQVDPVPVPPSCP